MVDRRGDNAGTVSSSTIFEPEVWHYLAVIFADGEVSFFADGRLDSVHETQFATIFSGGSIRVPESWPSTRLQAGITGRLGVSRHGGSPSRKLASASME